MTTDEQILALHKKYAKSEADLDLIYTHSQIIETIALQLLAARQIDGIDRDVVHVGALLHDIGVYDVIVDGAYVQGVRHGVFGEKILQNEGYPEVIWRIASHHTGVGLTAQDVVDQKLPIPVADYLAITSEERLIMYADKFHTKGIPQPFFHSFEECRQSLKQFGDDKAVKFDALAEQFGKPDITALSNRFGYPIHTLV